MNWTDIAAALMLVNLIGISSNLDNTGVGVAYGITQVRFPHRINLVVNLIGFGFAWIGAAFGAFLSQWLTPVITQVMAFTVLSCLGWTMLLLQSLRPSCTSASWPHPTWREGILLGVALSATNLASSIGASVTIHLSTWVIALSIAVWGYVALWLGNRLGTSWLSRWLGDYGGVVAGLLMIGLGVHQMV
ncbi:MAG: manganese efflux pump [Alicyclobacillus sp.]|nr:manganese efflux pump [Alicyclobacillus sp.]